MNATDLSPACRRTRQRLIKSGSDVLPLGLQPHLEACPDCADYARSLSHLEQALREPPGDGEPSRILSERILQEVATLDRPEQPSSAWSWQRAWLAGVAVLVLLAGLSALRAVIPGAMDATTPSAPTELATLTADMGPGAASLAGSLPASASVRLQQEAHLVAKDLEAAAGYLASCWQSTVSVLPGMAYRP